MGKGWNSMIPEALWTYWTTFKTPIGQTPHQLIYGKTCHTLVDLEFRSHGELRGEKWISNQPGLKRKSNRLNWMNGGRRPATAPSSTRSRWKDDTINGPRSSISMWEICLLYFPPSFARFGKLWCKWKRPCLVNPPGQWRECWTCSLSPNYRNSKK